VECAECGFGPGTDGPEGVAPTARDKSFNRAILSHTEDSILNAKEESQVSILGVRDFNMSIVALSREGVHPTTETSIRVLSEVLFAARLVVPSVKEELNCSVFPGPTNDDVGSQPREFPIGEAILHIGILDS
jgi:hypothetical protein